MKINMDNIQISNDKTLLNFETIYGFLSRSYWASKRSKMKIDKSIENSVCYGVYHDSKQIGFARIVTDEATFYWLCDVIIDEEYRGLGIGKRLIETITSSEEFKNLFGFLGTRDAHGLYNQYGFKQDPEKYMGRMPDLTDAKH